MLHQFVTPCNACQTLITPLQCTIVSTCNSLLQLIMHYNAFPSFVTVGGGIMCPCMVVTLCIMWHLPVNCLEEATMGKYCYSTDISPTKTPAGCAYHTCLIQAVWDESKPYLTYYVPLHQPWQPGVEDSECDSETHIIPRVGMTNSSGYIATGHQGASKGCPSWKSPTPCTILYLSGLRRTLIQLENPEVLAVAISLFGIAWTPTHATEREMNHQRKVSIE